MALDGLDDVFSPTIGTIHSNKRKSSDLFFRVTLSTLRR